MPPESRLVVRGLTAGWDRSAVVQGADLDVGPGEIVAVLGGNGSGKSSLLWAIAGLLRPRSGQVMVDNQRIDRHNAERVARLGVRLLPQARRVFPSLTVGQNLAVTDLAPVPDHRRRFGAFTRHRRADHPKLGNDHAEWLDRFPVLRQKLDDPAASLSGGEQQLVSIGRVVGTHPRVLLLDEPSAGLPVGFAAECSRVFEELAARGTAIVLVEQNVNLARGLASRTLHMRLGRLHADV